ncbi:MAG: hypothetical protein ACRD90_00095 [Nitrosopumilaceae archaeon]
MARPIMILIGAIPVVMALLIVIPQLTKPEIPITAADSNDVISIEYSAQHLKKIQFGITDTIGAIRTELLSIQNDGNVRYSVTIDGKPEPDITDVLSKDTMKKLKALIKETGFMQIPRNSFTIKNDVSEYDKFGVKITLNGITSNIQWPEQNATSEFIPPLIVHVKDELDGIISEIIE